MCTGRKPQCEMHYSLIILSVLYHQENYLGRPGVVVKTRLLSLVQFWPLWLFEFWICISTSFLLQLASWMKQHSFVCIQCKTGSGALLLQRSKTSKGRRSKWKDGHQTFILLSLGIRTCFIPSAWYSPQSLSSTLFFFSSTLLLPFSVLKPSASLAPLAAWHSPGGTEQRKTHRERATETDTSL